MTEQNSENENGDVVSLVLHKADLETLSRILDFTDRIASLLAKQELDKGAQESNTQQVDHMNDIAASARELNAYLSKNTAIGEPSSDQVH